MRTQNSYNDLAALLSNSQTWMVKSEPFRNATVTLVAQGSANLTIKVFASNQRDRPDLSESASITNQYAEVQITGLVDGASIDGNTWVAYSGSTDWVTRYEVNDNNNRWLGFKVSGHNAGSVTPFIDMSDNS